MTNDLSNYTATTSDWRKALRQNNTRTFFIIFLFFLIYGSVGVLVDMLIATETYPQASLPQLFLAICTFNIFPIATSIMLVIAGVSLLISYALYDKLMLLGTDYREITPEAAQTPEEIQLYNVVEEMKIAAGLKYMPKVFIINANYMNAFASGYSEKSAMVAITSGLMQKLNRAELQAVMAHELSHIKHLDIKVTLTASLLSNLTLIALDFFFMSGRGNKRFSNNSNNQSRGALLLILFVLRYTLPLISILLLLYLSRTRELMADAGCISLMRDNSPLASALLKIQADHIANSSQYKMDYQNTPHENIREQAYIYSPTAAGFKASNELSSLFSTHPSLEKRLAAIGFKQKSAESD